MEVLFKILNPRTSPNGDSTLYTHYFPEGVLYGEAVMDFYSTIYAGLATVKPLTKNGSCEINVYAEGPVGELVHERAAVYVYKKQPK